MPRCCQGNRTPHGDRCIGAGTVQRHRRGMRGDDDLGDRHTDIRRSSSARPGLHPGGVIARRRSAAPPVICSVGWPPGRLTTPRSEKNTPAGSRCPAPWPRPPWRRSAWRRWRPESSRSAASPCALGFGEHARRGSGRRARRSPSRCGGCRRCRSRCRGSPPLENPASTRKRHHPPVARSTLLIAGSPRSPAITFDRCACRARRHPPESP